MQIVQMKTNCVEQGRYIGREQARQATEQIVKRCLMRQLGRVPSELFDRIHSLSLEQLESLHDDASEFNRVENLHDWLDFN
jgi:Domain of unknown function (DUF4351)